MTGKTGIGITPSYYIVKNKYLFPFEKICVKVDYLHIIDMLAQFAFMYRQPFPFHLDMIISVGDSCQPRYFF